jgi:phospholipase C
MPPQVTVTGTDGSSYTLTATGGTQVVSPTTTTTATTVTYTATATGTGASATATATVTVNPAATVQAIQPRHLHAAGEPYVRQLLRHAEPIPGGEWLYHRRRWQHLHRGWHRRQADQFSNQDDEGDSFKLFKLASTCVDDESSDWLSSYGDVNRYDFLTTRPII